MVEKNEENADVSDGLKEDGVKDEKPEDVEQGVGASKFDGFLDGYKPNGKRRRCTDFACLLMLLACWAGITYFGIEAVQTGEPDKLLGGIDYQGRICGVSGSVANEQLWTVVSWDGSGKCVKKCPSENTWNTVDWFDEADIGQLICKDQRNQTAWWANYPYMLVYYQECMFKFESTSYLRYCVVDDMTIFADVFEQFFDFDDAYNLDAVFESTSFFTTICGDVYASRAFIGSFGFCGAVLLSFAYAYAMRIPIITKTVVWGSIWSIFFFALSLAGYAHYMVGVYKAEVPPVHSDSDINTLDALSIVFFAVSMVWLCLILYLKDRLTLAIGLIIQTAKALVSMPIMVIAVPLMQVMAYTCFTIPWCIYCIMLAASGDISVKSIGLTDDDAATQISYKSFEYSGRQEKTAWFLLFGYFWTAEFIVAMGQIIVAMCLSSYYFTRDKSRIGNSTVFWATGMILRYHVGTVAFGSMIVAIVRMIRAYITYLEKYSAGGGNKLKRMVLRCLQCFMACIERCIKYINFNAYIQTCIWGTGFCFSAKNAFWLIFRNLARIVAVTGITHFLSFIGKVAVVLGTAGSFYYVMDRYYSDEVSSLVLPTLIVALIASFIAIMFFEVFGMGTTVLLQCFVADEELHKENPEECFADGDLRQYLSKHGKSKKKKKTADNEKK